MMTKFHVLWTELKHAKWTISVTTQNWTDVWVSVQSASTLILCVLWDCNSQTFTVTLLDASWKSALFNLSILLLTNFSIGSYNCWLILFWLIMLLAHFFYGSFCCWLICLLAHLVAAVTIFSVISCFSTHFTTLCYITQLSSSSDTCINHDCDHECHLIEQETVRECYCHIGYELDGDGKTCNGKFDIVRT